MKYRGDVRVIEEIERTLVHSTECVLKKDGTSGLHSIMREQVKSVVFNKIYEVHIDATLLNINLGFDYRNKIGNILVRDDKAWIVASAIPKFAKLMCQLEPYYTHGEFSGEFTHAVRKLINGSKIEERRW